MEECSQDLCFFLKLETDHLVFWWGGAVFFQQVKTRFFSDKVKAYNFCNHKNSFYNCYYNIGDVDPPPHETLIKMVRSGAFWAFQSALLPT